MKKNDGIDYVICAAGSGLRLRTPGVNIAKPLLKIKGLTLIERSLSSLDLQSSDRLIIITQKTHQISSRMNNVIKKKWPTIEIIWVEIDQVTSGQLETAILAKPYLRGNGVAIFNSDTYFRSAGLVEMTQDKTIDGIIPCSREEGHEWSFCKADSAGRVLEVAEKNRISDLASVGYYYFRSPALLLDYAEIEIAEVRNKLKESYVAPIYNRLIKDEKRIVIILVEEFKPMGTPAQLQNYWQMSLQELAQENADT